MAKPGHDPFDFGDLYMQTGMGTPLTKKTMAQQRQEAQKVATPSPAPATSAAGAQLFAGMQPNSGTMGLGVSSGGIKQPTPGVGDPFGDLGMLSRPTPMAAAR